MSPTEAIDHGRTHLDSVLLPHGFAFELRGGGNGSGGTFADAAYTKPDRELTFSYRWALGCVTYRCGESRTNHHALVEQLGISRESKYEWFDRSDPMNGFIALASDLTEHLQPFLSGSLADVRAFLEPRNHSTK